MAQPTLISYTEIAYNVTTTPRTSASISWQTGDVIVVLQGLEDPGTITLPAATGLTFVAQKTNNAVAGTCADGVYAVVAGATSSGGVTCARSGGTSGIWGASIWVYRGSAGIGNSSEQHTTTKTVALTPTAANCAVVWGCFDFSAGAAGTIVPTPTNTDELALEGASTYTAAVADLDPQASGGATSYGISGGGTGPFSIVVLEIKASAGGGAVVPVWNMPVFFQG